MNLWLAGPLIIYRTTERWSGSCSSRIQEEESHGGEGWCAPATDGVCKAPEGEPAEMRRRDSGTSVEIEKKSNVPIDQSRRRFAGPRREPRSEVDQSKDKRCQGKESEQRWNNWS